MAPSERSADARLDELDRDEMWDVCRALQQDMTREQFEAVWEDFLKLKNARALS